MTDLKKRLCSKRQAIRLHIEQMKVTRDSLKKRAKAHSHDAMAYHTAKAAVNNLQDKIETAQRELSILERKWVIK